MSRPVWARGLKQANAKAIQANEAVAPCMGAWIETPCMASMFAANLVAPCMGAWIETTGRLLLSQLVARRALYGRVD